MENVFENLKRVDRVVENWRVEGANISIEHNEGVTDIVTVKLANIKETEKAISMENISKSLKLTDFRII